MFSLCGMLRSVPSTTTLRAPRLTALLGSGVQSGRSLSASWLVRPPSYSEMGFLSHLVFGLETCNYYYCYCYFIVARPCLSYVHCLGPGQSASALHALLKLCRDSAEQMPLVLSASTRSGAECDLVCRDMVVYCWWRWNQSKVILSVLRKQTESA
jgi:hypothetical protein